MKICSSEDSALSNRSLVFKYLDLHRKSFTLIVNFVIPLYSGLGFIVVP